MKLAALQELAQTMPDFSGPEMVQWVQTRLRSMGMDPNAIYQELEMSSRFVDTHRDTGYANSQPQLHSHTFYELIFCCNSCGAEYLVGSERYRLREGDIIFIPPGVSHRPLLPEDMTQPYSRYVLWLSREFMEYYAALFSCPFTEKQARANMLRTGGTRWEHLGDLFRRGVLEAEQRADGWEAAVIGNTMTLLTQIKRATNDRAAKALPAEKPELLDRITAFVEANYAQPITIGELSRQFYVSSSTVSHLFKQKLGVSFYRYVSQRRLIAAKTLIGKGEDLKSVALQTGFRGYSGFYRVFKQEFGISPRQYRAIAESAGHNASMRL